MPLIPKESVIGVDSSANPFYRDVVSVVNLDGSPVGINAPTLSDVLLTDSTNTLFIARDNGTTLTFWGVATNAAYTPSGLVQVADTIAMGTDNAGVTQLASGTGIRGWLSGIYSKLLNALLMLDAPMASFMDSTTTAGYIYFLQASPGTLQSSATGWQVSRMNTVNAQIQWPSTTGAAYTNAGTGYAALNYI